MPPIPCALFPGSRPACPAGPTSSKSLENQRKTRGEACKRINFSGAPSAHNKYLNQLITMFLVCFSARRRRIFFDVFQPAAGEIFLGCFSARRRRKNFFWVKIKDFEKVGNRAGRRQVGNYFGLEKKNYR